MCWPSCGNECGTFVHIQRSSCQIRDSTDAAFQCLCCILAHFLLEHMRQPRIADSRMGSRLVTRHPSLWPLESGKDSTNQLYWPMRRSCCCRCSAVNSRGFQFPKPNRSCPWQFLIMRLMPGEEAAVSKDAYKRSCSPAVLLERPGAQDSRQAVDQ